MSHSIADEFPETASVNANLIHSAEDSEPVIEAEMIENQAQASATPYNNYAQTDQESERGGSLAYQCPSVDLVNLEAIATYPLAESDSLEDSESSLPPIWQDSLENLLTPWGMSSILLLLLGNILISWAQFSPSPSLTTAQNTPPTASITLEESPKLIRDQPKSLSLDTLSNLPPSSLAVNQPSLLPKLAPSQASKLPHKVKIVPPNPSLTTALLPPSLRPQFAQYPVVPQATIPVRIPQVKIAPVSPPATVTQSVPLPPAIKTSGELPPPPSAENPEKAKATQDLIRQQMIDQMQRQETIPTLGFNQETRLKMQSIQNQTDLNSAREQLQQLQQQYNGNREQLTINN